MTPKFHPLKVSSIEPLTSDSLSITFEIAESLRSEYTFRPGQHLNLRAWIDEVEYRRSYSICSAPFENTISIGVKRVRGGIFSNWIFHSLRVGDEIEVMTPEGEFYLDTYVSRGPILAIASGSGITPIISMIKQYLRDVPHTTAVLLYGNRDIKHVMFHDDVLELKDKYLNRFIFLPTFSRQRSDVDVHNGRVDADKLIAVEGLVGSLKNFETILICGPFDMIETITKALISLGVDEDSIKYERFGTPNNEETRTTRSNRIERIEGARLKIIFDGLEHSVVFKDDSRSILDAGIEYGLDLPYSCKGGVCSTCKAILLEGDVTMSNNFALTKTDVKQGYILTCQSIPSASTVTVNYDVR